MPGWVPCYSLTANILVIVIINIITIMIGQKSSIVTLTLKSCQCPWGESSNIHGQQALHVWLILVSLLSPAIGLHPYLAVITSIKNFISDTGPSFNYY